jgi:hypothetical protein
MFQLIKLAITVTAGGAATVVSENYNGLLYGLKYVPDTLDTGADLTITSTQSECDITILTITNAGTSEVEWYPRLNSCGATGAANTDYLVLPPVIGALKVVVAQGGVSMSGTLYGILLVD